MAPRLSFVLIVMGMLLAMMRGAPAAAQVAPATRGLELAACIARVAPGDRPAAMLWAEERFDCTRAQTAHGPGDFWVRIRDLPASAGIAPSAVRSLSLWQRHATLRIAYADGAIVARRIDDRDATRSLQLGAIFEQSIPVRGVQAVALLWHVEGSVNIRGVLAKPVLVTPAQSRSDNLLAAALYGGFAGLALALIIYNLAAWAVLRQAFQIDYCIMVALLAAYAFTSSGAFGWMWPDSPNTLRIRCNYLLLSAAALAAIAFARSFFEPRVVAGATSRAATATSLAIAVTTIAFALRAPWQAALLDDLYALSFLALLVLSGVVMFRAWMLRSDYLWIFALGWSLPLALAALRTASTLQLVPYNVILDNSTLAAMALEAIASSVAITYRVRTLLVERDEALARETAARNLADADPLTALLNRRAFLREAMAAAGGAGGQGSSLLVLVDIDHFKHVNDTLGHDGGDEVLRRVAGVLRRVAPPGVLVARLGGEEFALLAPGGGGDLATEVAGAVRDAAMPFDLRVTVSIGSAHGAVAREAEWSALYRRADRALYAAKEAGRDRIRHAPLPLAA